MAAVAGAITADASRARQPPQGSAGLEAGTLTGTSTPPDRGTGRGRTPSDGLWGVSAFFSASRISNRNPEGLRTRTTSLMRFDESRRLEHRHLLTTNKSQIFF